jgi:hypothetical protein
MIALAFIVGAIVAYGAARRYAAWRDSRPMIARNADLWAHTMPYEPSARERRQ